MKRYFITALVLLAACTRGEPDSLFIETSLILGAGESLSTRADMPDETRITDWNLLVFNAFGDLEEHLYVPSRAMKEQTLTHTTRLLRDVPYTIVAAANMGYQLPVHCLQDLKEYRYHLSRPDDYADGIPMAITLENVLPLEQMPLRVERLMARVDLRMDRRELEAGVLLKVTEVSIGNCPSSVSLFPGSGVETASQAFQNGFSLKGQELDALNRDAADALSGTVSLYLLENCSQLHPSYVEIKAEYHSDDQHTDPGAPMSYRVPLEEVVRNTVYPITVVIDL